MVDLADNFKRNICERAVLHTIRYTSFVSVIYAVDSHHRVETRMTRMTHSRRIGQSHFRSPIALGASFSLVSDGSGQSTGSVG